MSGIPSVAQLVRERFGELTEIQKIAIPKVLSGENVLVIAPTGWGKTESVLLPVLERIKTQDSKHETGDTGGICALYITPLRALSRDLTERFSWWCERLEITHDLRTGDTTQAERAKMRSNPPKILLTTVESLQALLMGKVMRKALANVKFVIVDEIHDIMDNKRGAQLSLCLERLAEIADFQRIGISATIADEVGAAKLLFGERDHAICEVGRNRKMDITLENLDQKKMNALLEANRTLLFVNTRSTAEELSASIRKDGVPVGIHHGSLSREVRLEAEESFKIGKTKSLLCTSSLELGMDIGDITLVIQYGSPHQVFRLVQRVGRSGHSLTGTPRGVIFTNDFDDFLESEVIRTLAQNGYLEKKQVERSALDVIANQLVGLTLDLGPISLSKAHEIFSRSYAYGIGYDKLRMIALQLYSEGLVRYSEEASSDSGRFGLEQSSEQFGKQTKLETTQLETEPETQGKEGFPIARLKTQTPRPKTEGRVPAVWIRPTLRARTYYISYLSTIPKTKRFMMKDVAGNRIISSLDEEFVANLEPGVCFLCKGMPWRVIDITDKEVLSESGATNDIIVPSWVGEDIPVEFEVAQHVGKLRTSRRDITPNPDDKSVIIEIVQDIVIIHACFGSRVNASLSRLYARNLSRIIGESVRAVSDPYRILVKLPYALGEEHIVRAFHDIRNVDLSLREAIVDSSLLKLRFTHVGRLFGLLSEEATISGRFIEALRNSVVYEEAVRSIFSRHFDVERSESVLEKIRNGELKLIVDKRKKPSFFASIGIARFSGGESLGAFEPRERIIAAFKENAFSKAVRLLCLSCGAERLMLIAGAPESGIVCHKCHQPALAMKGGEHMTKTDQELSASLIRAHGKRALVALSTYGIGPSTAARVLKKLAGSEEAFYLDLIEAQKLFVKNKKYWKI